MFATAIVDSAKECCEQSSAKLAEFIRSVRSKQDAIKDEVKEAKKKAYRILNDELMKEHRELMKQIQKHNIAVDQLDNQTGVKPLVEELSRIKQEIKALECVKDYYWGK